jgi:cell division protein FtsZ
MTEVNEAAKVITASADEDAKIIFGAAIDPKLKDEIKITVVATGFDGKGREAVRGAGTDKSYTPNTFIEKEKKEYDDEENNMTERKKSKVSPLKAAQAEPAKKKGEENGYDEDDELGIPAFIRKKMM